MRKDVRETKKKKAALAVIASAMLWGTYGSFLTAIEARGMSADVINFLRFAATSLPIMVFLLAKDRAALRIKRKDVWLFAANGLASILFFTACYAAAIRETKIATAAALLYTAPAIVLLLSALLFREKLTRRKILCVLLSVLGCALVSGLGSGGAALFDLQPPDPAARLLHVHQRRLDLSDRRRGLSADRVFRRQCGSDRPPAGRDGALDRLRPVHGPARLSFLYGWPAGPRALARGPARHDRAGVRRAARRSALFPAALAGRESRRRAGRGGGRGHEPARRRARGALRSPDGACAAAERRAILLSTEHPSNGGKAHA